jgi:hypothetical protein
LQFSGYRDAPRIAAYGSALDCTSFRSSGVYRPTGGFNLIGITQKLAKIGKACQNSPESRCWQVTLAIKRAN